MCLSNVKLQQKSVHPFTKLYFPGIFQLFYFGNFRKWNRKDVPFKGMVVIGSRKTLHWAVVRLLKGTT